jgi:nucleotide-binding universal stress UspA family protein
VGSRSSTVLQNILAAVELDGSSATALATAAELARLSGAQLHVLHAAPSTGAGAERALASAVREAAPWAAAATRVEAGPPAEVMDAGVSDAVRQEVEGVRGRVEGFAGVRVEEVVEHADHAAAAIVARAAAEGADLLVLGTRGQSGAGEMLGSVSSEVVRESGCPVLLVPAALGRRYADDVVAGG